jgi:hypothetical protein
VIATCMRRFKGNYFIHGSHREPLLAETILLEKYFWTFLSGVYVFWVSRTVSSTFSWKGYLSTSYDNWGINRLISV